MAFPELTGIFSKERLPLNVIWFKVMKTAIF
jgi:hypothetical protein